MQRQFNGEKIILSTKGAVTTGHSHSKKKKKEEDHHTLFTKLNSKLISDLNVKHKTIKPL